MECMTPFEDIDHASSAEIVESYRNGNLAKSHPHIVRAIDTILLRARPAENTIWGYCPICSKPGISRTAGHGSLDQCVDGHEYQSVLATARPKICEAATAGTLAL